jgi:polyisoprenoid-binding protein YceI
MKKAILMFGMACGFFLISCEKYDDLKPASATKTQDAKPIDKGRQDYALNAETSVAEWKGHTPNYYHEGSFSVASKDLEVVNGKVKRGTFIIPIISIKNFNLPDEVKPILLDHLKSADFFNMVLYPEATFTIKKVKDISNPAKGAVAGANTHVTGDFTMVGHTREISFPAKIEFSGSDLTVVAAFQIDRTRWGMNYAADPALGDHQILPQVDLHLKLAGKRQ